ncbi:hypothetical protein [Paraburkholderia domus]|jgi:hypothetical protein|uniref:Uncharacterized protein n=1 Tax=Paraburkholderia domus TaxID=2793075 RepID=A0A9N8MLZ3_9BURK|nr:hypothetical protein [Paraburkholderia domus]MBK5058997.1 hypothetical protein [Burkholderia sp. R-70199]MBK5163082.1 hypothetical protein [Burkholderia sp. R-70211]MBK5184752.1 hypothetical protein [Burkholderia sp. R-69749]MCI0145149.1 hypothetical protein [Paraburkholderia sediminicola]CAE6866911.1 hypothetical protein R75471_00606 [Paraburkholderia domus]
MRLVFRIDLSSIAPCAALCAAAVSLIALPAGVNAQEFTLPQSVTMAETADAGSATLASTTLAVVTSPTTTAADTASAAAVDNTVAGTNDSAAFRSDLAGNALSIPADAAPVNDLVLDDQALSRQRGGFSGMLMVAATPQLMRGFSNGGNGVTLWDEIAPPSQLPVPVDVARSAQGNVTSYQRN